MQHNIEDQTQLKTLEAAWQQVESTHNSSIEDKVKTVLNSLTSENISDVSKTEQEREVEKDNIDVDEDGRASGSAWTEIEIRNEYEFYLEIPQNMSQHFDGINPTELDSTIEKLLTQTLNSKNPNEKPLNQFIQVLEQHVKDKMYDWEEVLGYEPSDRSLVITMLGVVDEDASREANEAAADSAAERKDPYGYRGLSRSMFL